MNKILITLISFSLISSSFGNPPKNTKTKASKLNIRELALPSEVEGISKSPGSIFYSPSVKDKVLMPVHFWGEISKTGLHFIPLETSLIKGISLAGGPKSTAIMDKIRVSRQEDGKLVNEFFDIENGGDKRSHEFHLKPGDIVHVDKSNFYANRGYYTSLIGVFSTILSTYLIISTLDDK